MMELEEDNKTLLFNITMKAIEIIKSLDMPDELIELAMMSFTEYNKKYNSSNVSYYQNGIDMIVEMLNETLINEGELSDN